MNKVILIGRLTKDPEVRYSNEMAIARATIAVDRKYKKEGEQSADFVSIVAFSKIAEFFEKYLRKGTKIALDGRIQTGSYTNKDNVKVYTTDVVVENVEFAESKNAKNDNLTDKNENNAFSASDFMAVPDGLDEELPFA